MTYGTWYEYWRTCALRLKMFSAQEQKTYDLGYHKKLPSHSILELVYMLSICQHFRDFVDRTWHCFYKQCENLFFHLLSSKRCFFLRIAVSFFKLNFQQTQPRCNNYIHILIISCILATMPAWRLCFRFQQRWKVSSFVEEKPDREMRTCLLPFVS